MEVGEYSQSGGRESWLTRIQVDSCLFVEDVSRLIQEASSSTN